MSKVNIVLAVVLAIQIVLILVVVSPFGESETGTVDRVELFDGVAAGDVLEMRITDDEGKSIDLAKEGGEWVVASAGGYPVKADKVEPVIEKILGLEGGRPVTRKPKNYVKLEVAEEKFQRKVELLGDGGREIGTLLVGASPNYNLRNVRREAEEAVYVVSGVTPWELATDATQWVDTRWLDFDSEGVRSLSLRHGDLSFEVVRGEDGGWRMTAPEDAPVTEERMEGIVRGFSSLYLSEVVGKGDDSEFGFDDPTAVVEIVVEKEEPAEEKAGDRGGEGDGSGADSDPESGSETVVVTETHRVVIGAERDEESDYYAKRAGSDFVVTISSYTVENKFLRKLEDFLPAEEKAEGGEEPGAGEPPVEDREEGE
jgi:hypothetical protein